jgi:hypothetical protein
MFAGFSQENHIAPLSLDAGTVNPFRDCAKFSQQ